jgi:hypothetical protein
MTTFFGRQEHDMTSGIGACIARRWHGRVLATQADIYSKLMEDIAIPDYLQVEGNLGAFCLRSDDGAICNIVMLSFWRDLAAIERYAGKDYEKAQYYDFDDTFLLEKEERVQHFSCRGTLSADFGGADRLWTSQECLP